MGKMNFYSEKIQGESKNYVGILLSTFNGSILLQELLDSIDCQSSRCWKIFVRDDGSIDGSVAYLEKFRKKNQGNLHIVNDGLFNLGACISFSRVMEESCANYFMFCDQDDVWLQEKISKTLSMMKAAEKMFGIGFPLLIHTDLCVVDKHLQVVANSFWTYQNINPDFGSELNRVLPQNVVTGCTMMINRPLADLAAPIPADAIMHDWWIALVAATFGKVVYLDEATILYRQHGNNSVGAKRWGLKRILHQAQHSTAVRESMLRTMRQAQALLDRYRDRMSPEQVAMVDAYAKLPHMSKSARIKTMFKYRFFKHGMMRNIGFLANLLMLKRPIR